MGAFCWFILIGSEALGWCLLIVLVRCVLLCLLCVLIGGFVGFMAVVYWCLMWFVCLVVVCYYVVAL